MFFSNLIASINNLASAIREQTKMAQLTLDVLNKVVTIAQALLDADTSDKATIADLQAQLAAALAGTEIPADLQAKIDALAASTAAATPAPAPPTS